MPPDSTAVIGILPLMQKFYETAGLHTIWEGDRQAFTALTERYHQPLAKMLFDTEIYLKIPSAGRLGRGFHGLYRSHGRARTDQRPELWIGLFRSDFSGVVIAENGADPAYLSALSAGSSGHEVS